MNKQIVFSPSGERMVMLPEAEFDALIDELDDARDLVEAQTIQARVQSGEEKVIPSEVVMRFVDGDSPIRVWRDYRGLSLTELASEAKMLDEELAEIETDQQSPTVEQLKAIAKALKVTMDDLVR